MLAHGPTHMVASHLSRRQRTSGTQQRPSKDMHMCADLHSRKTLSAAPGAGSAGPWRPACSHKSQSTQISRTARCCSLLLVQVKEARSALQTAAGAAWQGESPAFVLKRALAFACLQYGFQGSSQSGWAFQQVPVPAEQVQQHVGSVSVRATEL